MRSIGNGTDIWRPGPQKFIMHLVICLLVQVLLAIVVLGNTTISWDLNGVQRLRLNFNDNYNFPGQEYHVSGKSVTLPLSEQEQEELVSIELFLEGGSRQRIALTEDDFTETYSGRTLIQLKVYNLNYFESRAQRERSPLRMERVKTWRYKPY